MYANDLHMSVQLSWCSEQVEIRDRDSIPVRDVFLCAIVTPRAASSAPIPVAMC
jgi:hypothetical protein